MHVIRSNHCIWNICVYDITTDRDGLQACRPHPPRASPAPRVPCPLAGLHPCLSPAGGSAGGAAPSSASAPSWQSARGPLIPGKREASYLPTVWLASCLIRLNCFFILGVCALPAGAGATPHYFTDGRESGLAVHRSGLRLGCMSGKILLIPGDEDR